MSWKSGDPSIVGMYMDGRIQLKSARYEINPPTKKMRRKFMSREREGCARPREVLEPAKGERRDRDRDHAKGERHQEREPDLAAKGGVAERDDAPVGRQDRRDRVRPRRKER